MTVMDPGGGFSYGNQFFVTTETHSNKPQIDIANNAERVVLPASSPTGLYIVRVKGFRVVTPIQKYSMVVTGNFDAPVACPQRTCLETCIHGVCSNGACKCAVNFYGPNCNLEMPHLMHGVVKSVSVNSMGWAFFAFVIEGGQNAWSLSYQGGVGNPDLFIKRSGIPSFGDYDVNDLSETNYGTVSMSSAAKGVYVVGVNAVCCTSITTTISLTISGTGNCGNGVLDAGRVGTFSLT